MKFSPAQLVLIFANLAYIIPFSAYYIWIGQGEFLWYVAVLVFFFSLILATIHKSHFTPGILWGLSLWGLGHMAGGGVKVGEGVLYSLPIVRIAEVGNTYILKYDQVIHAFGFFVATLVVWHLLQPYLNEKARLAVVLPIVWVAGMGLGALNEVIEFLVVLTVPDNGVGGYFNTALDMVFNMLGALLAVVMIAVRRER